MTCSIRSRRSSAVLALLLAVVLVPPARGAEPQEREAMVRARALSDWGRDAYAAGDYEGSLQAYAEAYTAVPLPAFLFNIAQAHRQLGHYAPARLYYQRYLAEAQPAGSQRLMVVDLMTEMARREADEEARGAVQLAQGGAHMPLKELRAPPALWQQWWFWTGVGAAVVGGGALAIWASSNTAPRPATPATLTW